MGLFDNRKAVAALFNTDSDVDQAVTQLQALGYGHDDDEISIIDQHRLDQESPVSTGQGAIPAPASGQPHPAGMPVVKEREPGAEPRPTVSMIESTKGTLTSAGIDDEEAAYLTEQIVRGAKLVIVKAKPDDVAEVERIFQKSGQTQVNSE